jgi:hypothetical protein
MFATVWQPQVFEADQLQDNDSCLAKLLQICCTVSPRMGLCMHLSREDEPSAVSSGKCSAKTWCEYCESIANVLRNLSERPFEALANMLLSFS